MSSIQRLDGCGGFRNSRRAGHFVDEGDVFVGGNGPIAVGFAARMHQLPEDRKQLIFRIRRQIAENTYDTPQKLEIALERLFDDLE